MKRLVQTIFLLSATVTVALVIHLYMGNVFADGLVISKGDFALSAENKWDRENERNYASISWDSLGEISQGGYRLFVSDNLGETWENVSMNYGETVKVLNVYPDIEGSNRLKEWMDQEQVGLGLVNVTPITITEYNSNPEKILRDNNNEYIYDVIFFGSWDTNNAKDLNTHSTISTKAFMDSGRGVLFGHDTIWTSRANFRSFQNDLGITTYSTGTSNPWGVELRMGSSKVRVIDNGYLMKYPHELANNLTLTIPYTHSAAQMSGVGTNRQWLEFIGPFGQTSAGSNGNHVTDPVYGTNNFYLLTKGNLAIIQTGHSNGQSTEDEMKILVNTLYNLAQVSFNTFASDYTVKDSLAPNKPTLKGIEEGTFDRFSLEIDSLDQGNRYQWKVEADYKAYGELTSDIVQEEIVSNIAGYFYRFKTDTYNETDFLNEVENLKNEFGRIPENRYDLYVAPQNSALTEYNTKANLTLNGTDIFNTYGEQDLSIMVLAVDRANNVGQVTTAPLIDYMPEYRVTERYIGLEQQLKPDTYVMLRKGEAYVQSFPTAGEWIPYGYEYADISVEEEIKNTTVTIPAMDKNFVITYRYLAPVELHVRQVIADASDKLAIPDKGRVSIAGILDQTSDTTTQTQYYMVESGVGDVPYTKVTYPRLYNEHASAFSLHLESLVPTFYAYKGSVVSTDNRVHTETNLIDAKPVFFLDQPEPSAYNTLLDWKNQFWVTLYIEPAQSDGSIQLNVINQQLHIYYTNTSRFTVFINGEKFKDYEVENKPSEEVIILEVPVSEMRHKITVEYENKEGNKEVAYWNNHWDFVDDNR
ncbi:hypothetical protein A5886_001119 [Enterococcus sp. 8G7_MSG3316]|uniref:DUF5057 domain-containing protein n=1 Tax=Candidatus Enterococcus testudinis TaxID=1834191 RepID=A0A242A606_9ENTE|nr:hypothetical protein [Enterococcus sp. 8G7_MSG3316]OTN76043.1 hypothetical protein A5886_001119 [Enterococcus sp. 8G7_MSG3316]